MKALTKILTGAAGVAAVVGFASPASAQYYPGYGYPNSGGGVLGQIVNGVLGGGYGQYPYGNYGYNRVNDRYAVDQCARAVEARLGGGYNQNYGYGGYGGYGNQSYGYNNYGGGRVTGITRVERRSGGGLKVYGVASTGYSGRYGNQGYGYNNYGGADVQFNCKIDSRGRITDVDIDRNRNGNYGYRRY